jgi:hypothetical protein
MMTDTIELKRTKWGKLAKQLLGGGILGAFCGYFGTEQLIRAEATADQAAVIGVGFVYLLMAILCAAGLAMPKLGAKMLNVEDEEELQEQRRVLTGSSIAMAAIGIAMVLLGAAEKGGWVSPVAALDALLIAFALSIIITWRDWKYYDELMLQVSRDAGNFAFLGVGSAIMLWSAAAHLDFVDPLSPLMLVALITGGMLLAVFIAAGLRGMLHPR